MNPTTTPAHGITLDKIPGMGTGTEQGTPTTRTVRRPWYPLVGHRQGLRRNDMTTLASALWILGNEGGTAHYGHCDGIPGQGCGRCEGRNLR